MSDLHNGKKTEYKFDYCFGAQFFSLLGPLNPGWSTPIPLFKKRKQKNRDSNSNTFTRQNNVYDKKKYKTKNKIKARQFG